MTRMCESFLRIGLALAVIGGGLTDSAFAQQAAAPANRPAVTDVSDDGRAQYPAILADSYVTLNIGYIDYPFSSRQLEPGHSVQSVQVPHLAVQAVLFGHHFGKYLSAQGAYMRPIEYVRYSNVDGPGNSQTAWMHFGTATLLGRVPLHPRLSVYGEGGLAITSRRGFQVAGAPVMPNAHFTSVLLGAGVEYQASRTADIVFGLAYVPAKASLNQPQTTFGSAGVRFNMRKLPVDKVRETVEAGFPFPANLLQVGYSTNAFGYGANNLVSNKMRIFWGGHVEVGRSLASVNYQRNLFHTKKVFSIDLGGSVSHWESNGRQERFTTLSVYPVLRFTVVRTKPADFYAFYSVAGPTYISREIIDELDTGGRFTFQDFMGVGVFIGANRRFNAELNLNHYSNGNILQENAGVKIPLTFKLGLTF
jgi:hypothetical protein